MAVKSSKSKAKAFKLVEFALEKKAKKPVVLDVQKISTLCDYMVICSGETSTQVSAIHEEILKKCRENSIVVHHCEQDELSHWVLIDLFDVMVHIFIDEARNFYNLEYLWHDAKKVTLPQRKKILA